MCTDTRYREVAMFWLLSFLIPAMIYYFALIADYERWHTTIWAIYVFAAVVVLVLAPLVANQPPFLIVPYVARMWWEGSKHVFVRR